MKPYFKILCISLAFFSCATNDDTINNTPPYPTFGSEIEVTIHGLTFDAMEPFVSSDGKYLFFNNLNDGINTKLFYATKVNDSTFNFVGELMGPNQTIPPHLDAVPDMDAQGKFLLDIDKKLPYGIE